MLTGLKVSCLLRKYVFYRPELTEKSGHHGIEILSFWNAKINESMYRAQRVDERNGVTCLVIVTLNGSFYVRSAEYRKK